MKFPATLMTGILLSQQVRHELVWRFTIRDCVMVAGPEWPIGAIVDIDLGPTLLISV